MDHEDHLLGLRIQPSDDPYAPPGTFRLLDPTREEPLLARGTRPWCEKRRLEVLRQRHGTGNPNLTMPTLGGKQVWGDVMVLCGWRIQENSRDGRCRLLDPEDKRRAWGSWEACRVALEAARLEKRLRPHSDHAVVLLHGLIRSRDSMDPLAQALSQAGYEVINANYPSARRPIEDHAQQINHLLSHLRDIETVSFVTHSLGGIVVRTLLSMDARNQPWRGRLKVGRTLMIFPPNQGALKADRWRNSRLARVVMGPPLQELTPQASRTRDLPTPRIHFAIIAGSRDTTVRPNEASLPGAEYTRVMDAEHTFGMQDPDIIAATLRYINGGSLHTP